MNLSLKDASHEQRFEVDDEVSHNAGLIESHTKRIIKEVCGYDSNGGVRYRLQLADGSDRGLAYDQELDPWPEDESTLPQISPRTR